MEDKSVDVRIPASLYREIEKMIEGSEFNAVEDYIVFVLEELMTAEDGGVRDLTGEDERLIEKRLRDLGYLD